MPNSSESSGIQAKVSYVDSQLLEVALDRLSSSDEWVPDECLTSESEESVPISTATVDWNDTNFIVFESCLMQLFAACTICLSHLLSIRKSLFGSMLQVHAECLNGHRIKWSSQPVHKQMPFGNLFIAASCLF